LKGQREEVWFEIKFEGIAFNIELTSGDFNIGNSYVDEDESFVLFEFEFGNYHY